MLLLCMLLINDLFVNIINENMFFKSCNNVYAINLLLIQEHNFIND